MFEVKEVEKRKRSGYRNWREYTAKPRAYVFLDEETVAQNFGARFNRPYKVYRPLVLKALEDLGIEGAKISWRQKAGCTCGCSPGFVIDLPDGIEEASECFDLYITVSGPPTEIDEAGAFRLAQLIGPEEALKVQRETERALIRELEEVGV